jgi:lauroyl/myristoyl acyltransferase
VWLYLAIQAGALGSRILPLTWRYRLSTVIADLLWLTWTAKRRICIDNMSVVLGGLPTDAEVRRVARRSFQQFGKGIVDFLGFSNIDPHHPMLANMPIAGWEHVSAALQRGKGVILATAHFGSIDLGGLALGMHAPNFYAVADTFHPASVDRLVRKTREAKGFRLIPTTAVRQIIRALRENALVVMLFDRPLALEEGVPVRFFGRETALPAGPAIMALRTGAAIVPAFVFREPNNTLRGHVFPAVTEGLQHDRLANVRLIMQRLADVLQQAVLQAPEQWYMFRPMWPGEHIPHLKRAGTPLPENR